jgi:hypothetical protein
MQGVGSPEDSLQPWADARRWLLVVPVALLPFAITLVGLIILKTALLAVGVHMLPFVYLMATGASAYLSITWSSEIAPHRGSHLSRALTVGYVLISATVLFVLLFLDHHPPRAVPGHENAELIQMLAAWGFVVGGAAGHLSVRWFRADDRDGRYPGTVRG